MYSTRNGILKEFYLKSCQKKLRNEINFSHFQEQRLSESAEEDGVDGECAGLPQAEKDRDERTGATALNRSQSINRHRLVAHSTPIESIQAESKPIDEQPNVP